MGNIGHMRIRYKYCIKIILLFSLLSGFLPSAHAIVIALPENIKSSETKQKFKELEKLSHEKAKSFPQICAIIDTYPQDISSGFGTGTYFARNNSSGFILTAAHLVYKEGKIDNTKSFFLTFDEKVAKIEKLKLIPVKKIYIHPKFEFSNHCRCNDIAIIEVVLTDVPSEIRSQPIAIDVTSADNYEVLESAVSEIEALEGIMLGYGYFGLNALPN